MDEDNVRHILRLFPKDAADEDAAEEGRPRGEPAIVAVESQSGCADDFCREGWVGGGWGGHSGGREPERLRR